MHAVILCAGYATRLYPLTLDRPKSLLPVAGKPLLDHIVEKILEIRSLQSIVVVSNHKFAEHFRRWLDDRTFPVKVSIVDDGSDANDNRLGAIRDLLFAIDAEKLDGSLLVVAGDNLLQFGFEAFRRRFTRGAHHLIAVQDMRDPDQVRSKYGVVVLKDGRVLDFQEKPEAPRSSLRSVCCYLFRPGIRELLKEYLESNDPDATGFFLEWLHRRCPVDGYIFAEPAYDIGDVESYQRVCDLFSLERP